MESVVGGSGRIVRWEMVTPSGLGTLKITSTSLKIEVDGPEGLIGGGCSSKVNLKAEYDAQSCTVEHASFTWMFTVS